MMTIISSTALTHFDYQPFRRNESHFKPILNLLQVLTTIDYLEDNDKGQFTEQYFQELREYQPRGPLVNSEYYTGWLDKWGSPHKTRCELVFNIKLDVS